MAQTPMGGEWKPDGMPGMAGQEWKEWNGMETDGEGSGLNN